MATRATGYRAFLLRMWSPDPDSAVRASVTDVHSGEIHTFADLDLLHEWLRAKVGSEGPSRLRQPPARASH